MSGAEFIAVTSVISSIIAIVNGIQQVVEAADEAEGLPKAFRQASRKLPIISDILEAAKHNFEDNVSSVEKSVTLVVKSCQDKWNTLSDLFEKVIPEDKASRVERYHKAVKTLGKGGKVESLMKGMLEDILLLASIKTMTMTNVEEVIQAVTVAQEEKVTKAITDIEAWPPSVPDEIFQEGSYVNNNYAGQQYIAQAGAEQNNFQGDSRQYHSGGGPQTFTFNDSPVNAEFHHHAPTERPETPPSPSVVIPFPRDTDFIKRKTILDQIHQKCTVSGSRTALVGLGGVGKSQLAIEHAYLTRDRSPETWVFWVHASNTARFEESFRHIANCLRIPGRQNSQANIFQLVHDWLCSYMKGKWVLILDNVDDAGFLVKAQSIGQDEHTNSRGSEKVRPLIEYLPQCPNGSILITTQSKSAALKVVEQRDIISVEPMDEEDGLALFKRKLGWHDDGKDAVELVAALEFMPLAIVQAAAYLSQRAPRYSVRQYLQDFQGSNRKRTSLLNYDGEQLRRDWGAEKSIIKTWQISFDHIRKIRPSATDLLSLMSFFDRQGIPETLLRNRNEPKNSRHDQEENNDENYPSVDASDSDNDEGNGSQSSVNDRFEDDILALRNYSFVSVDIDGTTFEMHRLVQLATQEWLKASKQQERWKQQFIRNLCAELPTGEYENWAKCQALFPHAQSAISHQPYEHNALRDWASILYKAAHYAYEMRNGVEAEKMSVQVMKVRKKILGREHDDTLSSITMVSLAYKLRGKWDAAEELQVQVMEMSKKKLSADHPHTLASMSNLASTFLNQGRWNDAEELEVQVMEIRKKKLGVDHPDTLSSMNNLASTFWNQGRWDDAEELEVQVMEIRKKKLGVDHPDTLTSMNNLAFTWKGSGKETEAIILMEECVQLRKRVLGLNHPHSISSCITLNMWKSEQEDIVSSVQGTKDE